MNGKKPTRKQQAMINKVVKSAKSKKVMEENLKIIDESPSVTEQPVKTLDEIHEQVIANQVAFLQRQRDYRAQYLFLCVLHEELKEMRTHIESYDLNYDSETKKSDYKIPMLWEGMSYPINILKVYYNMKHNSYLNAQTSLQKFRSQLLVDYGLTDKQCDDILINGTYIKESPRLKSRQEMADKLKSSLKVKDETRR